MAKAQSTIGTNSSPSDNREDFKARQIEEAKERAELRCAQRDAKYGNEAESRRHRISAPLQPRRKRSKKRADFQNNKPIPIKLQAVRKTLHENQ